MVERRSAIRAALVWDAVQAVLAARSVDAPDRPLEVVDLGGGTGGLAVRVAELGHHVVVVDPSPDALASLERRAADAGMVDGRQERAAGPSAASWVTPRRCPTWSRQEAPTSWSATASSRSSTSPPRHWTPRPEPWHPAGRSACSPPSGPRPSSPGRSVGHVADARAVLADPDGRWGSSDPMPRRFTRDQLVDLLGAAGFAVGEIRGVRVFADHLSSSTVESEPGAADAVRALEAEVATHPDFIAIATQLHLHATHS